MDDYSQYITKAIQEENVYVLVKALFDLELTPYQEKIVRTIAWNKSKRVVIAAMTRYGKSLSVSIGILLYILFNKDKKFY